MLGTIKCGWSDVSVHPVIIWRGKRGSRCPLTQPSERSVSAISRGLEVPADERDVLILSAHRRAPVNMPQGVLLNLCLVPYFKSVPRDRESTPSGCAKDDLCEEAQSHRVGAMWTDPPNREPIRISCPLTSSALVRCVCLFRGPASRAGECPAAQPHLSSAVRPRKWWSSYYIERKLGWGYRMKTSLPSWAPNQSI